MSSSTVTYNGVLHTATFVSSTRLTISLSTSDQATAGNYPVVVTNPAPGGGPSNAATFVVDNPVPNITSLSPSASVTGAAAQTLTINGTNFVLASTVTYNGVLRTATFVSSTRLTISLSASDQATAGSFPVAVNNPSPGGGSSSSFDFIVQAADALSVIIQGLPSGTSANVTVSGPGSFNQNLTQTTTLNGLSAGTYSVLASIIAGGSGSNVVYVPIISGSPANVTTTSAAAVNVSYQSLATVWQPIGPSAIPNTGGLAAGKLQAFAVSNGNPSVMYAAGGVGPGNSGPYSEAGLYMTTNGGNTWQHEDSGLSDPAVDTLWMDQSNLSTIVAGTYSTGIFQTTNGGSSWMLTGSFGSTTALFQSGGMLYAGTSQGIAASTDDGSTWNLVQTTSVPVRAIAGALGTTYAGLNNGEILVQASPSSSWSTAASPAACAYNGVWSIAVNPTNPQNAFVAYCPYANTADLYETTNGGASWALNTGVGCTVQAVAVEPSSGALYAACGGSLHQSSDGGNTWTQFPGAVWDMRLIVPDAAGIPGNLVVGSDQGLYLLPSGSTEWQSLNGNLTSSILFDLDASGSNIFTSVQDFSPISSFDGGANWQQLTGSAPPQGEAGVVAINPGDPNYVYAFTLSGFQLSTDGGQTYTVSTTLTASKFPGGLGNGDLISVDRTNPSTVYVAATDGVYKSTDWGSTWTLQTLWPISHPTLVALDPTNDNNIFVGEQTGALLVSHDDGSSWTTSSLTPSSGWPATLAVNPSNPQVVLVGMTSGSISGGGILVSKDGGNTFNSSNTGIAPQTRQTFWPGTIFRIRYDPSGSEIAAAATNTGIYVSSDNGTNWVSIRGNAVPYMFSGIVWSGGNLYVSTFGEGVLSMPFPF